MAAKVDVRAAIKFGEKLAKPAKKAGAAVGDFVDRTAKEAVKKLKQKVLGGKKPDIEFGKPPAENNPPAPIPLPVASKKRRKTDQDDEDGSGLVKISDVGKIVRTVLEGGSFEQLLRSIPGAEQLEGWMDFIAEFPGKPMFPGKGKPVRPAPPAPPRTKVEKIMYAVKRARLKWDRKRKTEKLKDPTRFPGGEKKRYILRRVGGAGWDAEESTGSTWQDPAEPKEAESALDTIRKKSGIKFKTRASFERWAKRFPQKAGRLLDVDIR